MVIYAQYGLIIILTVLLIFHIFILFKIIPYKIIWGGRLSSDKEMYRFETTSILVNLFFLFVVFVNVGYLEVQIHKKVMITLLWIMTTLFVINASGNLFSKNKIEQFIFTPIALITAAFSMILALSS